VLIVRLKQCEHALADGRLDQAYEFARTADFRADRRGQELIDRLARALVRRGAEHAQAGRIQEASADCERAASLAGNTTQVAELRAVIADATNRRLESQRLSDQQFAAAKRHIDAGQLTVGQNLLGTMDRDWRADALNHDLAARRERLGSALSKASAAFAAGDWQAAIDHLSGLRRQFPDDRELRTLSAQITSHVTRLMTSAAEAGRLDNALLLLTRLDRLDHASVEVDQLRRMLQDCRSAFDLIRNARAHEATQILRRLAVAWPNAGWLTSSADRCKQVAQDLEDLHSGPLGSLAASGAPFDPHETIAMPEPRQSPRPPLPPARKTAGRRFMLQVDGIGSFLVIEQALVTIGPVSSNGVVDVPLLAGASVAPVTISRADGDYFLRSPHPISINDKPTTGRLLSGGEKIAIGPRCRITFRRPSAASGTALLDLTGVRLPRGDVRQVILLDREILIGPGSTAHVRCDELAQPIILQPAGAGKLLLRSAEAVQIDGRPAAKPAEIHPGGHVRIGPVSFVVTEE
jgi:tetratricopeptide (TPR) repeat protein